MSQIVAIIANDSIIVASESQYSIGSGKQYEQQKIAKILFKDEAEALVAFAGDVRSALRTVFLMQQIAKGRPIANEFTVIETASQAIGEYRKEVLTFYNQSLNISASEQDKIFLSDDNSRYFELVVAYYFGPNQPVRRWEPYLYKVNVGSGTPERCKEYALTGSGTDLASFILDDFVGKPLKWVEAISLAIDVLERIKDANLFCGGKVKAAVLDPKMGDALRAGFVPQELINRIVAKVNVLRQKNAEWYKAELTAVMKAIHQENVERNKNDSSS